MPRLLQLITFALAALVPVSDASELIERKSKVHWAFQAISNPSLPTVSDQSWPEQPLDHFVLAKLEENKLTPSLPADRRTLLRRVYLTLTGLNPSLEETEAFVHDQSPEAFGKVIDQLLASPNYGERWGRHWLDIARYADTKGYVFQEARQYPYAYTYRDWVIRALNEDMPYDQFVNYQIAADQIVTADADKKHLAAMGFLTVGRRFLNRQPDIIDDRIDVVTRGTMALTVACSRCHDHKYDPIPTADYYSLYGIFASSEEPKELPLLGPQPQTAETEAFKNLLATKKSKVTEHLQKRLDDQRGEEQLKKYLIALKDGHGKNDSDLKKLASERGLVQAFLLRWRDFVNAKPADDPIFAAWKSCFDLPTESFAAEVPNQLAAIFANPKTNPRVTLALKDKSITNLHDLAAAYAKLFAHDSQIEPHEKPAREQIRQLLYGAGTPNDVPLDQLFGQLPTPDQQQVRKLRREVAKHETEHPGAPPRGMVMVDRNQPDEPYIFIRGQQGNRGPKVPRQFPAIVAGEAQKPFPKNSSGRLEMAQHITSRDNPLTARVIVNRVWLQHFGQALVSTPSDFGLRSDPPSHPQLLDHLAHRFMEAGWSLKQLHRQILLSATFQQSSAHAADKASIDPANQFYWHANRKRLDFEALRDSLIQATGQLDANRFGRPYKISKTPFTFRRTIYSQVERQNLESVFRTFDFASPDAHCAQRHQTTVPQQALYMMNSPFIEELASKLSSTLTEGNPEQRIAQLYRQIFSRTPDPDEVEIGKRFIKTAQQAPQTSPRWQHGYGSFENGKVAFTPFELFTGSGYQNGKTLPHPTTGWVSLNRGGGHPGHGQNYKAIARFVAPEKGAYSLASSVHLPAQMSDGIIVTAVANGSSELASKIIPPQSDQAFELPAVQLEKGAHLDLIVACGQNESHDSFHWNPIIKSQQKTWSYQESFTPPKKRPSPWQQYAQALLSTNEFAFVD
ncbi:MAG: hypothetical protein ACI8XO_002335 [Verrucomicrobiales bacterium]|jgi:hypothetical protein